jgi:outer membrane protein OmpA-like peptidoglycan-associated protein
MLSVLAAGCSSTSEPPPAAPAPATGTTGDASFPNLGSVPNQPPPVSTPAERKAIMEGLISDRKNAVYSDQPLSGQPNSSVPPPAPPQPITPVGGGTSLDTPAITPPAAGDTESSGGTNTQTDAGPAMPAAPQEPVTSQPLPQPTAPAQPQSTQPQSNAAPLGPSDRQVAVAGATGASILAGGGDEDMVTAPATTQRNVTTQRSVTTQRGLIPKGPFQYPQAKPQAAAKPIGNSAVTVDLSVIGGPPATLEPSGAVSTPPVVYQPTAGEAPYQLTPYPPPANQPAGYQTAVYQWPNAMAPRVALPPSGQPLAIIYFADGSATLDAQARRVLRQVAEIYRAQGGKVRVVGHASIGGGDAAALNDKLSYRRAEAVARALMAHGVKPAAIEMAGYGTRHPIYAETAATGAAGNRRAEVFLTL